MSKSFLRKTLATTFAVGLGVLAWSTVSPVAHACPGGKHGGAEHACPLHQAGSTVTATKIKDGVQLTITSKDAKSVEQLQTWAAALASGKAGEHKCDGQCAHGAGHGGGQHEACPHAAAGK